MTITGLTPRQVKLLEQIWNMDTMEELQELKNGVSLGELREIDTLITMMIQEAHEEQLDLMDRYPDAEAMLARLKKDYL
jgi:hypothetical protein